MNTRHSHGISRNAAELLLDGHADPDADQLTRVLAAATAPPRDGELAGEQMAMAAFEASRLVPVATSVTSKKEHKSMLGKLFTVKVIASSVAALATGGAAIAASTSAFSGPAHVTATVSATPSAVASTPSAPVSTLPSTPPASHPRATIAPQSAASTAPAQPASSSPTASTPTLPQTAAALCTTLAGDVVSASGSSLSPSGLVQALSKTSVAQTLSNHSKHFASLISTAQSVANVPDYCALLLGLPQLPDPSQLAQLPGALLGQLLTALPTSTLAQILTALPSATLSQVLSALPTSALSTIVTTLPASVVAQLLQEVPTSTLTQLPQSVLSQLPPSVLSLLPSSILGII
ncbi:MAG TPA: hypothetical protein VFB06_15305 [Streptosporangiaceae bacterium]|nr:hypothetical protein [Streptosporangiaceae bacterium]